MRPKRSCNIQRPIKLPRGFSHPQDHDRGLIADIDLPNDVIKQLLAKGFATYRQNDRPTTTDILVDNLVVLHRLCLWYWGLTESKKDKNRFWEEVSEDSRLRISSKDVKVIIEYFRQARAEYRGPRTNYATAFGGTPGSCREGLLGKLVDRLAELRDPLNQFKFPHARPVHGFKRRETWRRILDEKPFALFD